ncbi:MAG: hypothetical protein M1389_09380 [Chloroflexi bacterium]|nr:hypothetical protein [Chloroflexota bacterium]
MIGNDREYQVTKSQLAKLEASLDDKMGRGDGLNPPLRDSVREGLRSQIEELREQIAEYERRLHRPK